MKKRFLSLLLALALLLACPALAAGGQDDPLVTQSYADQAGRSVLSSVMTELQKNLREMTARISALLGQDSALIEASAPSVHTVYTGARVILTPGACFTLLSGSADMVLQSGAVVNATVGYPAVSGKLNRHNRYMGCENALAYVSLSPGAIISVEGTAEVRMGIPFTDVPVEGWFFSDVLSAYERGLINGMSPTLYEPNGQLTVAQAIKLAACMHQLYHDQTVTLQNGSPDWYSTYLHYAVAEGIVSDDYAALDQTALNAPISRAEFVYIFYRALPRSEYSELNEVADDTIPDVSSSDLYGTQIYAFYRAGILTGDAADAAAGTPAGLFRPTDNIRRSEVATIMNRMFDSTARKQFTLG